MVLWDRKGIFEKTRYLNLLGPSIERSYSQPSEAFCVGLFAFLQRPILSTVWSSFHYCLLPMLVACREEIHLPFSVFVEI